MTIENQIHTKELPLSRKLTINVLYTSQWVNDALLQALKTSDVSLQQFNVLRILRGQKGKPANLSAINSRMVARSSNTTRLIDKLINKDLVKRTICPTNRRKIEILITEDGLGFLNKVDPLVTKAEKEITSNLTDTEKEQLNNLLNKLRNNN